MFEIDVTKPSDDIMKKIFAIMILSASAMMVGCGNPSADNKFNGTKGEVKLLTLDPGHFHAALVQM